MRTAWLAAAKLASTAAVRALLGLGCRALAAFTCPSDLAWLLMASTVMACSPLSVVQAGDRVL